MPKPYNVATSPKNIGMDQAVSVRAMRAIASCSHLTPRSEAQMDSLLGQADGRRVPDVAATIKKNEPKDEEPFSFGRPVATLAELAKLEKDFPDPDCEVPPAEAYESVA